MDDFYTGVPPLDSSASSSGSAFFDRQQHGRGSGGSRVGFTSSTPDLATRPELLREVSLHETRHDRERYENLGSIFAILQTIEYLEKAYAKDSISAQEYAPECERLIAQYRTALNLAEREVTTIESFIAEYKLTCPAALTRIKIGVPATVQHGGVGDGEARRTAQYVAEAVQHFITLMDSLKLNMTAVDQVQPPLNDLLEALNRVATLSADWEGKVQVRAWLVRLNAMKASDVLDEEQVRQLLFDLERAHTAFYRSLTS